MRALVCGWGDVSGWEGVWVGVWVGVCVGVCVGGRVGGCACMCVWVEFVCAYFYVCTSLTRCK